MPLTYLYILRYLCESLNGIALSPRFVEKMAHDIITGAPLIYRRTPDNQFILYSVGWNEKNDGGTNVLPKGTDRRPEFTEGDWVWQYPTPATSSAQSGATQ